MVNRYSRYTLETWNKLKSLDTGMIKDTPSVYFDIDGVLGKWYPDGRGLKYPEQILDPQYHYFRDIEPQPLAIDLAWRLHKEGIDVNIISGADFLVLNDKYTWIERNAPFIPEDNIFFCPIGADKTQFIKGNASISLLIDDFPPNLKQWVGTPIKALNDINSKDDNIQSVYVGKNYDNKEQFEIISNVNLLTVKNCLAKAMERPNKEIEFLRIGNDEDELDR